MVDKNKKIKISTVIVIAVVALIFLSLTKTELAKSEPVDWQTSYTTNARQGLPNFEQYTANTPYYDYNNPIVANIAEQIKLDSRTPEEAVKKTLQYVYKNVDYIFNEPDSSCFDLTAPEILESKKGQCDTQTIAVTAILRRMDIATITLGGCVIQKPKCELMSFFLGSVKSLEKPQEPGDISPEKPTFSRSGGLHAWAAVYLDGEWVSLEPTLGKFANLGCYDYHIEILPNDNQKEQLCVSHNYDYARACIEEDYDILNQEGLGLFNEVLN